MSPIRILHILHSMNRGGAENTIMNYYRHIDRDIVQFDFLLTAQDKCQFEDEIISMGGRVFRIPLLKLSNPIPYIRQMRKFLKLHPEYRIVHSHTSSKSFVPLYIAKQLNIPTRISHSHSSRAESGINGLIRRSLKPFLKAVSTDWLSCGVQAGVYLYGKKAMDNQKVIVFNNVIEAHRYRYSNHIRLDIRKKLAIDKDTFVVGHTARFSPVKNHKFDVDILVELKKKYSNCKLLEVGQGVEAGLSDYAREKGVLEDIIFTDVVNNVWDYEQAMDAFILPSFNEGLPLSIIEAQISGLPCFTTANGVSEECSITNLVTYISLEEGATVWAEKIIATKDNPRIDRFNEVIRAGYDASTSAIKLQEFYLSKPI